MTQLALPFPSAFVNPLTVPIPWRHRARYPLAPAMFSLFDDFDGAEKDDIQTRCAKPGL